MTDPPPDHFLDGNDLCAGCGRCCHDIEALRVTDAELARVPRLAPFVTHREGPFLMLNVVGACPYLLDDGRCGTFSTRPFDCSLYPVNVASIGIRRADGIVPVNWMFTAQDCPERPEMLARARRQGVEGVAAWVADAHGEPVEQFDLVHHGRPWREAGTYLLHRIGLLPFLRRVTGRPPLPRKPLPGK